MLKLTQALRGIRWVFMGACFSIVGAVGGIAHAQQIGSLDPISSAVPADRREGALRDARDTVPGLSGKGIRIRAEVWLKDNQVQGNFYPGEYWHDVTAAASASGTGYEVEQVWLLHASGVWTSSQVRRNASSGEFEFFGAPAYPAMSPVDVVVKFRGIDQLVQVRYRLIYPRG
jgi:hypothetical protein